jgi:hypothetical protein
MSVSPYLYAVSLPERSVRSLSALGAGLVKEITEAALPATVRQSAIYRATAGVGFRFFIEHVGKVKGIYPRHDAHSRQFVYRYATGTSIELLSIATFFVSPVWVLAALGDSTRVGKAIFVEIGDALKAEGLLDSKTKFETMLQLLDGLESTSTHLALTINMPPLDVAGLRLEWKQLRANLAKLPATQRPSASDVERAWANIRTTSRATNQSIFRTSTAMGVSALSSIPKNLLWLSRAAGVALRTTGMVVGGAFLEHYATAAKEMRAKGFRSYWSSHSRPYLVATVSNLLPEKESSTERLISYFLPTERRV